MNLWTSLIGTGLVPLLRRLYLGARASYKDYHSCEPWDPAGYDRLLFPPEPSHDVAVCCGHEIESPWCTRVAIPPGYIDIGEACINLSFDYANCRHLQAFEMVT